MVTMKTIEAFAVVIATVLQMTSGMPDKIRIGALFESDKQDQLMALQGAVEDVNMKRTNSESLLKDHQTMVLMDSDVVEARDSFDAQRVVCEMTQEGIAAMFGPVTSTTVAHVQSICMHFGIPHLQWRWDTRDKADIPYYSINLFPDHLTLSKGFSDVLNYWKWEEYVVLYEDNDGLMRLQDIMKKTEVKLSDKLSKSAKITFRKLVIKDGDSGFVSLFKELKARGQYRFLIDCKLSTIEPFLNDALKVKMVTQLYHFHFTNLDMSLLDLRTYMYGGANITSYRLINPRNPKVTTTRAGWSYKQSDGRTSPLNGYPEIATETALVIDAYYLFVRGLVAVNKAVEVNTMSLPCDSSQKWSQGLSLLNFMRATTFEGLSGTVKYEDGGRKDFSLDLMMLSEKDNGLRKVGSWGSKRPLNRQLEILQEEVEETGITSLSSRKYKVLYVEKEPYVFKNLTWPGDPAEFKKDCVRPEAMQGICTDILKEMAKKQNFTFELCAKSATGSLREGIWSPGSIIANLITKDADIAIGDLTINLEREKDIDFTKPYMTVGITILYQKPKPAGMNLFSFLKPLHTDVWVYMIAAFLCVSFMLFVIARISPNEWNNPHPCNQDSEELENNFTVMNSLWFAIGSLLQQGCEIAPSALSTRMVAGFWWFFTLIMISSYTANLAAFLTVERMVSDITGADDLAKQTKIKYGLYPAGSTESFFRNHDQPPYTKMWKSMKEFNSTDPTVFMRKQEDYITKIRGGNYAYITESSGVEYIVERNCDLMQVGDKLDSKGYGFATPKDSSIREMLTQEILRLQGDQFITKRKTFYWQTDDCMKDKEGGASGKAAELGVDNVGGVFVFLMAGTLLGFFVALCEFWWQARKNAKKDGTNVCSEMSEEFRFAVRCLDTKKAKKKEDEEITDNGLQFMPLTGGYSQPPYGNKEVEPPL